MNSRTDQPSVVYESRNHQLVADRALVLHSLGIPYHVASDEIISLLLVPPEVAERAKYEIWQYEQENPPRPAATRLPVPAYQDGLGGMVIYVVVLCAIAWLAGASAFEHNWFAAGRIDGELVRQGEWWRAVTALTLHADIRHLLGNLGFGAAFGYMAGRLLGSGVAWFTIVASATLANLLNTLLLESAHRSIGASTAVFAALGLLAGYVWRAGFMVQNRWAYRVGPIVGGLALLAYTGTGDENTDIGAHLIGFACGFVSGISLTVATKNLPNRKLQRYTAFAALASIGIAWLVAL